MAANGSKRQWLAAGSGYHCAVYLIGLTGGIASGKSVVARRLASLGAIHIDADLLAREVVEPGTAALRAITTRFGASVLAADGTLDRAALGCVVFENSEALATLNAIVHPAVQKLSLARFAEAAVADDNAVVVYDVPLLVEALRSKEHFDFDLIVVVSASSAIRAERLTELRGMSASQAQSRIAAQAGESVRLAIADVVIDSNGSLEHTLTQADALWSKIRAEQSTA